MNRPIDDELGGFAPLTRARDPVFDLFAVRSVNYTLEHDSPSLPNMTPHVSIGLPVYNGQRYLREAIESILGQSFGDFELIICDNASTDATPEICVEFEQQDGRVRYNRNKENIGAAANYGRVYDLSTAPYFKWAAGDDILGPDFLDICVKALDDDQSTVLATTQLQLIDDIGTPVPFHDTLTEYIAGAGDRYRPVKEARNLASPVAHKRFADIVLHMIWYYQIYGVIRAEALAKTSLHGSYPGSEKVLMAELALLGRYYIAPEPLFFNRVHSSHPTNPRTEGAVTYMDPKAHAGVKFAEGRVVQGYLRAISRAPISPGQKMACLWAVVRKVSETDNLKKLVIPGPNNYLGIGRKRS
jgi:hypothetical protein